MTIFSSLESRRKEWDNSYKDLHSRISTQARDLKNHNINQKINYLMKYEQLEHN